MPTTYVNRPQKLHAFLALAGQRLRRRGDAAASAGARDTHPDTTFVDAIHACPDGTPTLQQETHRLGNYFVSIRVLPPAQPAPVFHLLFQRRPDAGRFWKDLMARVLQRLRHSGPSTMVTLEY
jgi:hypothetical protein